MSQLNYLQEYAQEDPSRRPLSTLMIFLWQGWLMLAPGRILSQKILVRPEVKNCFTASSCGLLISTSWPWHTIRNTVRTKKTKMFLLKFDIVKLQEIQKFPGIENRDWWSSSSYSDFFLFRFDDIFSIKKLQIYFYCLLFQVFATDHSVHPWNSSLMNLNPNACFISSND